MRIKRPSADALLEELPAQLNDPTTTPEFKCAVLGAALAEAWREIRRLRNQTTKAKKRKDSQ